MYNRSDHDTTIYFYKSTVNLFKLDILYLPCWYLFSWDSTSTAEFPFRNMFSTPSWGQMPCVMRSKRSWMSSETSSCVPENISRTWWMTRMLLGHLVKSITHGFWKPKKSYLLQDWSASLVCNRLNISRFLSSAPEPLAASTCHPDLLM